MKLRLIVSGVVIASLAFIVLGMIWVVDVLDGSSQRGDYECPDPADLKMASVTLTVTVESDRRDYPRVTSAVEIRIPQTWHQSGDLFSDEGDYRFRGVVRCLLRVDSDDRRPLEWRDAPPDITVRNGQIVLKDTVAVDILEPPGGFYVGMAYLVGTNRSWRLSVYSPDLLRDANWESVAVRAPAGWLVEPWPWPVDQADAAAITWRSPKPATMPVEAEVRPDTRASVATGTAQFPANLVRDLVGELSTLAYVGVAIWLLAFARRNMPATATDTARQELADARRVTVVLLMFYVVIALLKVSQVVYNQPAHFPWLIVNWSYSIAIAAIIAVLAWRWWLPKSLAVGAGLVMIAVLLAIPLYGNVFDIDVTERAPHGIVLRSAFAFIVTFIVFAGALNAARVMFRKDRRPAMWVWIVSSLAAVILVAENVGIRLFIVDRQEWLKLAPSGSDGLCCTLSYYPWNFLVGAEWILLALVIPVLWVVYRASVVSLKVFAGILLLAGPMFWDVTLWAWTLPAWIVVVGALAAFFKYSKSVLDKESLRAELRRQGLPKLHEYTKLWLASIREGRANDRAAARGDVSAEAYADKRSSFLSGPARPWWRRFSPAQDPPNFQLPRGLSPIDVVIAIGPSRRPTVNARIAMRWAALFGIPIGVGMVWLPAVVQAQLTSDQSASVILSYTQGLVWQVLTWVTAGFVAGLLWQHLPWRRGPLKMLPLVVLYAVVPLLLYLLPRAAGGYSDTQLLLDVVLFAAVMTLVGVAMDMISLRPLSPPWAKPRQAFLSAYGMENFPAQFTFIVAQLAAVLAVWNFVRNGGDAPSYPSIDPFQSNKPGG